MIGSTVSSLFKAVQFNKYYSLNEERRLFFRSCLPSTYLVCQVHVGFFRGGNGCLAELAREVRGQYKSISFGNRKQSKYLPK